LRNLQLFWNTKQIPFISIYMKKIYSLSFILLSICSQVWAQIPNGDFELWNAAGTDLTYWQSTNGLSQLGNPQTVYRSTNTHSGTYACEINTKKIIAKPPGVFIPDYSGSMFIGKQISVRSIPGFPYTERPANFNFWYQFNARNNDSATALILLTRWNTTDNKRDTVGISYGLMIDSVGVYTKKEMSINYFDTLVRPDTAIIYFSAATNYASKEGAKLLLDELSLTGGTVGLPSAIKQENFVLYPNPCPKGAIHISVRTDIKMEQINLYNLNGALVYQLTEKLSHNQDIQLDLPNGMYVFELVYSNGIQRSKIIVE
jgi:hypothetical protein